MPNSPANWAQHRAWRVLDADFGQEDGRHFFTTWQAWRQDPQRPRMLHYVALCGARAPTLAALRGGAPTALVDALADQWFGLLPGFHRLVLDDGRLLLTLCVGEPLAALRELAFQADAVQLRNPDWDVWHFKALAHVCRRGTQLACPLPTEQARKALLQCGFEFTDDAGATHELTARFNPRWTLKAEETGSTEQTTPSTPPSHCVVVGAGLAGASVAAALARRGIRVDVLDAAPHPAAGASGLPVGLMAPQVSADDGTRSRLSRAGLRLSLQQARTHLRRGEDWDASGVLERGLKAHAVLPPGWGTDGHDWSGLAAPGGHQPARCGHLLAPPAWWHRAGAWVKPAALVRAWLASEGVRFVGQSQVKQLAPTPEGWLLRGEQGQVLAHSRHVVLANAGGVAALAGDLLAAKPRLSTVQGQVSWGWHGEGGAAGEPVLPPCPVNGLGSFVAQIPQGTQRAWYAGATFEHEALPVDAAHQSNLTRLTQLLPEGAELLQTALAQGRAQAWRGTRCTSSDRLPLVGPLTSLDANDSRLWVSTAMGARGLSLSVLCAELLVARLCGEPLPLEASLARLLDARRGQPAG